MKDTEEERLNIGCRVYIGEFTRYQAAEECSTSEQAARDYMRLYRAANQLPPKYSRNNEQYITSSFSFPAGMEEYESMTKKN